MMKKYTKLLILAPLTLGVASGLTSCNKSNGLTLRILNSEDYIYLKDPNDPEDKNLVDRFIDYVEMNYPEYHGVKVVYDTSDTNETIYSEIQTGKSTYDLINVSEYMAQRIVAGGFARTIDRTKIPNYENYASNEIKFRLDNIEATLYDAEAPEHKKTVKLEDYAVGYMWGTLGILFNPNYQTFIDREIEVDDVITDMQSFNALWDSRYKGTISIKNSMRDTYALGVMHTYEDEFVSLKDRYEAGEISLAEYKEQFSLIFNRCDETSVEEVRQSLEELKNNIFGLEVDSGKQDIVTQKIGVNLAWSGDAVYAMDEADDVDVELCYSVPENGSNIWSDVWIMPNIERSDAQYELAHIFLNYLSDPEIAALNMDYTGYTSFIGGDDILELVRDWYDIRTDEIYQEVVEEDEETYYYDIYSVSSSDYTALDYPDFLTSEHDESRDNDELYYFIPYEEEDELILEPIDLEDLLAHSEKVYLEDDDEQVKTYGDLTIVDAEDSELEAVDLSYFFSGTLEEYEDSDMIFYSDEYLPYSYEDENGEEIQNVSVGRQFFCQYPSEETINHCAVMEDYGDNNKTVMKMWENFKSDPLPVWAIVIFIIVVALVLFAIIYVIVDKMLLNKVRKNRQL